MSQESTQRVRSRPPGADRARSATAASRGVRCATTLASRRSGSMRGRAARPEIGSSTSTTRRAEDEELYFVQSGRARFELEGECVDAPAGTFVFARPGVKRTAFAEEPETTISRWGRRPGGCTSRRVGSSGLRSAGSTRKDGTQKRPTGLGKWPRRTPNIPGCFTTLRAARASRAGRLMRSSICGLRLRGRTALATTWRGTRISILVGRSRRFRRCS